MWFLDISSLVVAYSYDIKIEFFFFHNGKKEFGAENHPQHKGGPNSQWKG
jgi:hypothetical protein